MQVMLWNHPDLKEFSDQYSDLRAYQTALPVYENDPRTKLRTWIVDNHQILKVIELSAVIGFAGSLFLVWRWTVKPQNRPLAR